MPLVTSRLADFGTGVPLPRRISKTHKQIASGCEATVSVSHEMNQA
jgi:hypothetical protein